MEILSGQFKTVGISHDVASLKDRESVMLTEEKARRLLREMQEVLGVQEGLVLSTCNRTEIYYSCPDDRTADILNLLKLILASEYFPSDLFRSIDSNDQSVTRLFEVSIGLQSQVVGDMQITHQVKKAYQWSADEGMAGPFLHRLMHTIFYTNKRVVQETPFRDGGASISYLAKDMAEEIVKQITGNTVLVVGTGEIGRDLCGNLEGSELDVFVTNRTDDTARAVALDHGLNFLPYGEMEDFANQKADIIISSVSSPKPLFGPGSFDTANRYRYLIDLSLPRSVDPSLADVPGFVVYYLDELEAKASEALTTRMNSMEQVKEIVREELDHFYDWSRDMIVSPTIHKLKNALESIRTEELQRYMGRTTENEQKLLEKVTSDMMQRVLKLPVLELKAACKRGEAETLIDVLNDLFDLEQTRKSS